MQIQDFLPDELFKVTDTDEFESDGGILITEITYAGNDLKIKLAVNPGDLEIDGRNDQVWVLVITNLKREKLDINWAIQISYWEEHFLLWDYTKKWTDLYFNGQAENPKNLLSDIYQTHKENFKNLIEVEKYLNAECDFVKLCCTPFGLFAEGPAEILETYKECLNNHGMQPHYQSSYDGPEFHKGSQLKLLILGDSYFIGKDFSFSKL